MNKLKCFGRKLLGVVLLDVALSFMVAAMSRECQPGNCPDYWRLYGEALFIITPFIFICLVCVVLLGAAIFWCFDDCEPTNP